MVGPTTQRIGSDKDGFSVSVDAGGVHVKAWGFWNSAIATKLVETVTEACKASPGANRMVLDATELKPQGDDGVAALRQLVIALPKLGVSRTTVSTSSQLTRLQLVRLARDHSAPGAIQFSAEA